MSASSIPAGRAGGYARYLDGKTVAPERGDYYLSPDGELTQAPGRWLSDPETLQRLGIDGNAPVVGEDFVALMEGRNPHTGAWLRPRGRRRWAVAAASTWRSAPRSPYRLCGHSPILGSASKSKPAHAKAVEQAVGYLRERAPIVRRRYSGQVVEELAKDVIAAEYRHTTARGVAQTLRRPTHSYTVTSLSQPWCARMTGSRRRGRGPCSARPASLARSTAPHSPKNSRIVGYPDQTGNREERQVLRDRRSTPRSCATRSPAAPARSPAPRSAFVHATAAHPSAASCAASRSRTDSAKKLTTRARPTNKRGHDTGHHHGFGPDRGADSFSARPTERPVAAARSRIASRLSLTEHHAVFDARELRTPSRSSRPPVRYRPETALQIARAMVRDRRILTLQGGRMTTLAIRAQEQAIERRAAAPRHSQRGRDAGDASHRATAAREVAERIARTRSPPSSRRRYSSRSPALSGSAVLVGPGRHRQGRRHRRCCQSRATRRTRQRSGIAVSGINRRATRAPTAPPSRANTLTLDALLARAQAGTVHFGPRHDHLPR